MTWSERARLAMAWERIGGDRAAAAFLASADPEAERVEELPAALQSTAMDLERRIARALRAEEWIEGRMIRERVRRRLAAAATFKLQSEAQTRLL